jgi:hypothetical protein
VTTDYILLGIIAVITIGGGLLLLREAKRYKSRTKGKRRDG